jgi:diguanylate cyclase (GGDEF)-like protein
VKNPFSSIWRRLPGWLEFWIALSAATALISTAAVVFFALSKLATEVNTIDLSLTRQSAKAAVTAFEMRLRDNLQDYANWDDAALKLYNTPDAEFIADVLRDVTEAGVVFDTAFLIDEKDRDLSAYGDGKPLAVGSSSYFGPALKVLLRALRPDTMDYQASSGLVATPRGIAAVAVGSVVPYSRDIALPAGQRRLLLLAKHLTTENIARLRNEFVIPGFDLAADDQNVKFTVPLTDPLGTVIGSLGWTKRTPGTIALNKILPAVWIILALLSAVTGGIILYACINVRRAHLSRSIAEHAACHDFLTGLPNRSALKATYEARGNAGTPEDQFTGIVFIDLDGFKQVNDAYGHDIGDRLLRACAAGFSYLTAGRGILGRVGGDEFAVLVNGPDAQGVAIRIGEIFLAFLREPFMFDGREIRISTSVGVACGHARQVPLEELLRRADIAMYQAKKEGGDRVAFYNAEIDLRLRQRVQLAAALREALKSGHISVAYQIIADAQTQEICGVEALARWQLRDETFIGPDIFIPLAEENGLIEELGNHVLRQACRDAVGWEGILLSVNVSPVQFHNPRFDEIIGNILKETNFPPQRLDLELTERHLVSDPDQAFDAMEKLKERGISISLDDFGTGYSSIGYLKRFKFDRLKLDRSICTDVTSSADAQEMIQGTITIARSLGLEVTAEGVENEHQALLLRLAGCRRLQGYYFGHPVNATELREMLVADNDAMGLAASA